MANSIFTFQTKDFATVRTDILRRTLSDVLGTCST